MQKNYFAIVHEFVQPRLILHMEGMWKAVFRISRSYISVTEYLELRQFNSLTVHLLQTR